MAPVRSVPTVSSQKPYSKRRNAQPPTGYNLKRKVDGLVAGANYKPFYENSHDGPEPYHIPLSLPVPEGLRPADPRSPPLTLDDLECIRSLGGGAHGTVLLVQTRGRAEPKVFALKAIKKKDLRQHEDSSPGDTGALSRERRALVGMPWNPFVSGLLQTLYDDRNMYMMLECSPCGSFDALLGGYPLPPADALFYFANIVCGLEFLEKQELVHRDLKPGNIVVGADGYLSLCDFGTAKEDIDDPANVDSWFGEGTLQYSAPECISSKRQPAHIRYGSAIDWYSAGVTLYEMATGKLPFAPPKMRAPDGRLVKNHHPGDFDCWNARMSGPVPWPADVPVGRKLKSLVEGLLKVNANKRFGAHGVQQVMEHPWLATVDWTKMRRKRYIPPCLGSPARRSSKPLNPKHYPGLHFAS
ncbi:kinase-like domain-containing protein [Mycena filopes]|nr:kinase-like domain-containing protein [Mycena filopes]